jgi:hypothetical protein
MELLVRRYFIHQVSKWTPLEILLKSFAQKKCHQAPFS